MTWFLIDVFRIIIIISVVVVDMLVFVVAVYALCPLFQN